MFSDLDYVFVYIDDILILQQDNEKNQTTKKTQTTKTIPGND